ncbi:MAG: hypothetical protein MJD61_15615 [Proteobacteria bacterium]|nr:hypothetical protein [Pseudomonadota bacterium]
MQVHIQPTKKQIERYQRLLKEEWSVAALERALKLIEDVAELGVVLPAGAEDGPTSSSEYPISAHLREEYRERLEELNTEVRRRAPVDKDRKRISGGDRRLLELTWRCIAFLTFPAFARSGRDVSAFQLTGNVGFFDDIRSILFQLAAGELLPQLRGHKWDQSRRDLTNALHFHATNFWRDQPAHQHYLRSVFFQAVGDQARAGRELLNAYHTTRPRDPDLGVKAYSYWSFLFEHGQLEQAKEFALEFLRECPRDHLDDARQLVDSSYSALQPVRRAGGGRKGRVAPA